MTAEDKAERLAAALRANLKRRKAQARALAARPPSSRAANPGRDREPD